MMENCIPDQFLFINKTPRSKSLSHSKPEERFNIHSHVHSKHHKNKRAIKIFQSPTERTNGQGLVVPEDRDRERGPWNVAFGSKSVGLISPILAQPGMSYPDPFDCAAISIDPQEHRLLQYPFPAFIRISFTAEAMSMEPEAIVYRDFRHRKAITDRLQRCIVDQLTLYSTLAFCANCVRWAVGEQAIPDRPTEYYNLKAIEVLKHRLCKSDAAPDSWLVMAIYALGVSDMWARNYEASTSHLQIIRHFVLKIGGMNSLEPYLMESLILGDKYLAIGKFAPPILPFDWDPGRFPKQKWSKLTANVDFSTLGSGALASGFFELDRSTLNPEVLAIVGDILEALRVAYCLDTPRRISDPESQHWLFLRNQAFVYRLLILPTKPGTLQECCRVALLVWLLKITAYFGPPLTAKRLLSRLKAAICDLDDEDLQRRPEAELLFWIQCLGAMTAEYTVEREWFLRQTVESATLLKIKIEKEHFWQILGKYLRLNSEGGLQFARMVRAARGIQIELLQSSPDE